MKITKELENSIRDISNTALLLCEKGWAEKNAGNISINITDAIQEVNVKQKKSRSYKSEFLNLRGQSLLVTLSGSRMRDVAVNPLSNLCIIHFDKRNPKYNVLFFRSGILLPPTTELPTHLAIQNLLRQFGAKQKAFIHTHPTELIALSHTKEYSQKDFLNNLLWSMIPESVIINPNGIAIVPYLIPGSNEIALETVKALELHDVLLWAKHGCSAI